ncbi:MAG: hypothetical protein ABIK73_09075 [candidate division WOR-3 bacterium]
MPLPDYYKIGTLNALSTGIANQSIANGSEYIGSEIDNTSGRYPYMAVEVSWQYSTAPTANKTVELRILEAVDGSNYEDTSRVIAAWSPPADTSEHRRVLLTAFPLIADKFKLAVKNVDTGQSVTVTVRAWAYYDVVEDT